MLKCVDGTTNPVLSARLFCCADYCCCSLTDEQLFSTVELPRKPNGNLPPQLVPNDLGLPQAGK
jgi:hypothetical protein